MGCTVSGALILSSGAVAASCDLIFEWQDGVTSNGASVIVPWSVTAETDSGGIMPSTNLEPGAWNLRVRDVQRRFLETITIEVPDAATADIADLVALGVTDTRAILMYDGTAAEPALAFTNDRDTGFYRPGANRVGMSLGGVANDVVGTVATQTLTNKTLVSPVITATPTFSGLSAQGAQNFRDATLTGNDLVAPGVIRPVTPGDMTMGRYGAIGQGSTSADTLAWHDAWDDVLSVVDGAGDKIGGRIIVPPGTFLIENPYVTDVAIPKQRGVMVSGSGRVATFFEARAGIIRWEHTTERAMRMGMHDFTLWMAAGGNSGDLIYMKRTPGGVRRGRDAMLERIDIRSKVINTDFFNTGITLHGLQGPFMRDVELNNPFGPGVDEPIQHQGIVAVDFNESYGPVTENCGIRGGQIGIRHIVLENPGGEGGRYTLTTVDANTGYYISSAGTEPGGRIERGHVTCAAKGIHIIRKKFFKISGVLFYSEQEDNADYADVHFEDCQNMSVDQNEFQFTGQRSVRTHIRIDADCRDISMTGNAHESGNTTVGNESTDTGVDVAAGALRVTILDPAIGDDLSGLLTNGAGREVTVRHVRPLKVVARRETNFDINSATDTNVGFEIFDQEFGGNWAGPGPTNIMRVPIGQGIQYIECAANIRWQTNDTGTRSAWFEVDGVRVDGIAQVIRNATGTSGINIRSSAIPVVGDEAVRLVVRQSSGVVLPIQWGPDTWFEVKAVQA